MVFVFTFSLSPTLYNHIKLIISKQNYKKFQRIFDLNQMVAVCFLSTDLIWNALIYIVLNRKFRSKLITLFKNTRQVFFGNNIINKKVIILNISLSAQLKTL